LPALKVLFFQHCGGRQIVRYFSLRFGPRFPARGLVSCATGRQMPHRKTCGGQPVRDGLSNWIRAWLSNTPLLAAWPPVGGQGGCGFTTGPYPWPWSWCRRRQGHGPAKIDPRSPLPTNRTLLARSPGPAGPAQGQLSRRSYRGGRSKYVAAAHVHVGRPASPTIPLGAADLGRTSPLPWFTGEEPGRSKSSSGESGLAR